MKFKRITSISFILISTCLFLSCQKKETDNGDNSNAISKNIDTLTVQLTDVNVERLKVSQQILGEHFDQRISELIKEYERNKEYVSKVKALDQILKEERFTCADKPAPTETKRTGYPGILKEAMDDNFDLAIKSNDAFVAQVKFMNTKFNTLDTSAVNAIAFYERLTPDQKKEYFEKSIQAKAGKAMPAPDYQRFIARELLRGYYHYQYHIQSLFYAYYKQKTLNLLKGFQGDQGLSVDGGKMSQAIAHDQQFDIPLKARK